MSDSSEYDRVEYEDETLSVDEDELHALQFMYATTDEHKRSVPAEQQQSLLDTLKHEIRILPNPTVFKSTAKLHSMEQCKECGHWNTRKVLLNNIYLMDIRCTHEPTKKQHIIVCVGSG